MSRLLVVEDDRDVAVAMTVLLRRSGHEVMHAPDGLAALRAAFAVQPHLIILDLAHPRIDRWATLSRIRELSDIPVLLVVAAGQEQDRARGLRLGADGYLTKPFGKAELVARVDAMLRRSRDSGWAGADLGHGSVILSPTRHSVTVNGEDVSTTPLEFRLLTTFLQHQGQVLTPVQLLTAAWDDPTGTGTERVKFAVMRLRRKLGWDDVETSPLRAVRGVGYRLDPVA